MFPALLFGSKYIDEELNVKKVTAILAAFVITSIIGTGILLIGINALTNDNTAPIQNSPSSVTSDTASIDTANSTGDPSTVQQLQDQVLQLQSQLDTTLQQLSQRNDQLQQYQYLLRELQRQGLIQIESDGLIDIP
jgi:peptidoglycan hydrolase CwlO-like protein